MSLFFFRFKMSYVSLILKSCSAHLLLILLILFVCLVLYLYSLFLGHYTFLASIHHWSCFGLWHNLFESWNQNEIALFLHLESFLTVFLIPTLQEDRIRFVHCGVTGTRLTKRKQILHVSAFSPNCRKCFSRELTFWNSTPIGQAVNPGLL